MFVIHELRVKLVVSVSTSVPGQKGTGLLRCSFKWGRGDFKAYDRKELDDMREAGEKQEAAAIAEARKGMDATQVGDMQETLIQKVKLMS